MELASARSAFSSRLPDPGSGGAWDYFHVNAVIRTRTATWWSPLAIRGGSTRSVSRTRRIMWQSALKGDPTLRRAVVLSARRDGAGPRRVQPVRRRRPGPAAGPSKLACSSRARHPRRPTVHPAGSSSSALHPAAAARTATTWQHPASRRWQRPGRLGERRLRSPSTRRKGDVLMDLSLSQQTYRGLPIRLEWATAEAPGGGGAVPDGRHRRVGILERLHAGDRVARARRSGPGPPAGHDASRPTNRV